MTLSELILLIHWEVQKSFNLVEELASSEESTDSINIHMGMEKFELSIPITITEREMYTSTVNQIDDSERIRKFYYPLIIRSEKEEAKSEEGTKAKKAETTKRKGKVLDVEVRTMTDPKPTSNERLGHMTITLTRNRS